MPSSGSAPGVRPRRRAGPGALPGAFSILLALGVAVAGCSRESAEVRAARMAADRYLDALGRSDLAALRRTSTCIVPSESIVGGSILRIDSMRMTSLHALDSLAAVAADQYRSADSAWSRAGESAADSLFELSRRLARRTLLYRNARRAVTVSGEGVQVRAESPIRTVRIRVRLRFAGPLVGSKPIDRVHVLRALAVPRGPWIVFSLNSFDSEPRPEPI